MYIILYNLICFILGFLVITIGFFLTGQKDQLYDIYGCTFPMALLIVITLAIAVAAMASDSSFYQSGVSVGGCQALVLILALLLLLSMEISGFLAGFVMQSQVEKDARESFLLYMRQHASVAEAAGGSAASNATTAEVSPTLVQWVDATQQALRCCGASSPQDWLTLQTLPPVSCCAPQPFPDCNKNSSAIFQRGCTAGIHEWLTGELRIYSICCLVAACLQISGLGLTFVKRNRTRAAVKAAAAYAAGMSASRERRSASSTASQIVGREVFRP